MSINIRALTITGIIVAAGTYAICAVFVAAAPEAAATTGSYIVHLDLSKIGRSLSFSGAVIGLLLFTGFVALVCIVSGWVYNRMTGVALTK